MEIDDQDLPFGNIARMSQVLLHPYGKKKSDGSYEKVQMLSHIRPLRKPLYVKI